MQAPVLYEEPLSKSRMELDEGGGAVLITNPDGSMQLFLLTNDQKQQVAEAQAWKIQPAVPETYTVASCCLVWTVLRIRRMICTLQLANADGLSALGQASAAEAILA